MAPYSRVGLLPANKDHDAYYVSVMIAMAQAHFYDQSSSKYLSPSSAPSRGSRLSIDFEPSPFEDVKVQLITHANGTADFVVYTCVVPATFLGRFAYPTKAPTKRPLNSNGEHLEEDESLKLLYVRVPVWPLYGLKERLCKALNDLLVNRVDKVQFPVAEIIRGYSLVLCNPGVM